MDPRFKKLIQDNYVVLQQDTNALELVPHLWADRAISKNDKDNVEKHQGRQQQNSELYNILLRKGNHAYKCLVKAMVSTEQGHLAEKLIVAEEDPHETASSVSNVVTEQMPNGTIRFSIKPTNMCGDEADQERDETEKRSPPVMSMHESIVQSEDVRFRIVITGYSCEPLYVAIPELANVVKIKEYVELMCGIEINDQVLTYNNLQISDSDDLVTVFGTKKDVSVCVIPRFIFSRPDTYKVTVVLADVHDSDPIVIDVAVNDDVKMLKAKLKLEHPQNIPYYQLYVVHDGEECLEGNSMYDCGISEGSTLHCQTRRDYFPLRIRDTSNNSCFTVPVTGAMKLDTLRRNISRIRNVSANMYQLFYQRKRLSQDKMILEIDKFANLSKNEMKLTRVMPGMILITVRHWADGQCTSFDCYVWFKDNVGSIRQEIFEILQIDVEKQVLAFAGKILNDEDTFFQLGITKGSEAAILVFEREHIVELSFTILVSDGFHPTHTIKVAKYSTVEDLKLCISKDLLSLYPQIMVPDMQFYLGICGHDNDLSMLDDGRTVESYGLKHGDELTVYLQLESGPDNTTSCYSLSTCNSLISMTESFYLPDKGVVENPFLRESTYDKTASFHERYAASLTPASEQATLGESNYLDCQDSYSSMQSTAESDPLNESNDSNVFSLSRENRSKSPIPYSPNIGDSSESFHTPDFLPPKCDSLTAGDDGDVVAPSPANRCEFPVSNSLDVDNSSSDFHTCSSNSPVETRQATNQVGTSPQEIGSSALSKSRPANVRDMSLPDVRDIVNARNHTSWSGNSRNSGAIEVSSLRSWPNIEMSQVSVEDLSDALNENYVSSDEEYEVI